MGPLSINLEEIKYPYAVHYLNLNLYEHDVRIADMDVAPVGRANGQTACSCMAETIGWIRVKGALIRRRRISAFP
jgi:hypothetical protein